MSCENLKIGLDVQAADVGMVDGYDVIDVVFDPCVFCQVGCLQVDVFDGFLVCPGSTTLLRESATIGR